MNYTVKNIAGIDYLYLYSDKNRMLIKLNHRMDNSTLQIAASLFNQEFS
jgi:hypothetical protein|tara:strand:+ start:892 stop:1038 length:147 start_codon:yes stop_codon:yes gene_type:complete